MEYKTLFDGELTFGGLMSGELFRFRECHQIHIRGEGYLFTSLKNGRAESSNLSRAVVRVRIDRVENGVPVFVDA